MQLKCFTNIIKKMKTITEMSLSMLAYKRMVESLHSASPSFTKLSDTTDLCWTMRKGLKAYHEIGEGRPHLQ